MAGIGIDQFDIVAPLAALADALVGLADGGFG